MTTNYDFENIIFELAQTTDMSVTLTENKDMKPRIIILDPNNHYAQYIEEQKDKLVVKVFLKNHQYGEPYSKAEFKECFTRQDELIDLFNNKVEHYTFHKRGE